MTEDEPIQFLGMLERFLEDHVKFQHLPGTYKTLDGATIEVDEDSKIVMVAKPKS